MNIEQTANKCFRFSEFCEPIVPLDVDTYVTSCYIDSIELSVVSVVLVAVKVKCSGVQWAKEIRVGELRMKQS